MTQPERPRRSWREFRRAHPGILATAVVLIVVMLAVDAWLIVKRQRYVREIERLRAGMSAVERNKTDAVLAQQEHRLRVMMELIKRQARAAPDIHLAVAIDSGRMVLEQRGATLREMAVDVGGDKTVGTPPDTVRVTAPRGERSIERILGPDDPWEIPAWVYADRRLPLPPDRSLAGALGPVAIVLSGGTVIYSLPSVGPLSDAAYVLPGSIRARAADLRAIVPNLSRGKAVYLY